MRSKSSSRSGRFTEFAGAGIFYAAAVFLARYYGKPEVHAYYTAAGWFLLLLSFVAAVAAVASSPALARARAHLMKTKSESLGRFKYLASLATVCFLLSVVCVLLRRAVPIFGGVPIGEVLQLILFLAALAFFLMGFVGAAGAGGALYTYFRSGVERGSDSPAAWRELVGAPRLDEPGELKELGAGGGELTVEGLGGGGREQREDRREEVEAVPPQFDEQGRTPLQRVFEDS